MNFGTVTHALRVFSNGTKKYWRKQKRINPFNLIIQDSFFKTWIGDTQLGQIIPSSCALDNFQH
jgi:hypothetical protein